MNGNKQFRGGTMKRKFAIVFIWLLLFGIAGIGSARHVVVAQGNDCRQFPETGKIVCGRFLQYWDTHGGLAQQGFPLTGSMVEVSDTDGQSYITQYFERSVFEYHSANPPPNDVLLALLGAFRYNAKWFGNAPNQTASQEAALRLFPQTGKHAGGAFLQYWNAHGGLAQQGYPISEEFMETSDLDGQNYRVQYFERAVFEYHPEFAGTANEVLLSQLGTFNLKDRTSAGKSPGSPAAPPPALPTPVASNPPPAPAQGGRPPSDPHGFAGYIAQKYNSIGGRSLNFETVYTSESNVLGHYITLDLDLNSAVNLKAAGRARAQAWGEAILREAKSVWPNEKFQIGIDRTTYSDTPCFDNCIDDCYYQSQDYSSGRGWYTVFTYVFIPSDRAVVVCQYIT
jgi:hypothetical protein